LKNNKFTFSFVVNENEIDDLNHVNNIHYVEWIQNAAQKHWDILKQQIINKNYVWVVLRHEVDYLASAKLNDIIEISTWIGDSYGVKSERFVEVKCEGKILAKAKTVWCLLDDKSMKLIRIPSEIMKILQ